MEESEDNLSADDINHIISPSIKGKPKKRSLVERELETNLTARVTSPISIGDGCSTSRYGRARRFKNEGDIYEPDKTAVKMQKSPRLDKSPKPTMQTLVYKMHASNSPIKMDVPKTESNFDNQIENIYTENVSLSRFGSAEKKTSTSKRYPKVYIRKDLIQTKDKDKETEETVVLIKNMFSPVKQAQKSSCGNNRETSTEKYGIKRRSSNGIDTSSVVKTLDFDEKRVKKEINYKASLSINDMFELEAKSEYQVGDLAWARMGTYPFWPCIVTREPDSGLFVKRKYNGRRSWIADSMLRPFLGQLEFEATRSQFTPEAKKKDPKLYMAFFISEKKMSQWVVSVEEAEMLLREPKRLRIDILSSMLMRVKTEKIMPKHERSKKVTRTDSDVSLSESLYDTLFSEDDTKGNDGDRLRNKSKIKSLDVSDVVTACLDNMAAKTGITKIQRQSHMDRWLLKAKTKTPEKSHLQSQAVQKTATNSAKIKKVPKLNLTQKPYKFRSSHNESQNNDKLQLHLDENDDNKSSDNKCSLKGSEDCNENTQNFESSATEDLSDKLIDSNHDAETLSLNDDSCTNYKSNLSENTKIETCNINSKCIDYTDNKSVLSKLKQSIECEGDNIPSSSRADVSAMSTSLEISRVDGQTSDMEMISKTTDMSCSFLEITNDGNNDGQSSKDRYYQSTPITSSRKCDLKDSRPSSCTEKNSDTIGCMDKMLYHNKIDINTDRDINHIEKAEITKNNLEEENENIGTTLLLKNLNHDKVKDCADNANIKTVIQNIPFNENVTCVSDEIDDSECNKTGRDLECDSKIEISLINKNESMSIARDSNVEENNLNYTSCNNNVHIEKERVEINQNESEKRILKEESNIKNNICNGVLEEASKECSNFFIDKNFKKRNRTIDKSAHRNFYEPVEKKEIICKPEESYIVDDTTKIAPNHGKPNTRSNKKYKSNVNSGIDPEKSNINEIEEASTVNSKDRVCKKFNLSLCKYNVASEDDRSFTKNEMSNVKKDGNLIETKSIISNHLNDHSEDKQCFNETITNINCEKNPGLENMVKSSLTTGIKSLNSKIKVVSSTLTQQKMEEKHKKELNVCAEATATSLKNKQKQDYCQDTLISSKYKNIDSVIEEVELISSQDKLKGNSSTNTNSLSLPDKQKDISMETALTLEDSDSSTNKNKLKKSETVKTTYADPDFQKYLEFKQDAVMDEHPELSQEEIISYLYKTWLYEDSNKSEKKKSEEVDQTSLVRGTNYKALDKDRRIKLRRKKCSDFNLTRTILPHTPNILTVINGYHKDNDLVKVEINTTKGNKIEVNQPEKNIIDSTKNHCIKNPQVCSFSVENEVLNSSENDLIVSVTSEERVRSLSPSQLHKLQTRHEMSKALQTDDSVTKPLTVLAEDTENKLNDCTETDDGEKEYKNSTLATALKEKINLTKNFGTVSVISDDNEFMNKRRYNSKKSLGEKSMQEDPGFQKYLEFKQDSVIDEHPELSQEEVISYLYKTWLYEENIKSDKKSDEVDQTSLVKGANSINLDKEKGKRSSIRKKPDDFKDTKGANSINLDKEKGKRSSIRKKPDDFKDTKTKQTPTIIKQFLTQNGYHDFNKLLHSNKIELETFESDTKTVNSAQNQITKVKENMIASNEKHKEKPDGVDVVSISFEKPDASCSIANCEEAQLERDIKTSNEEPLKDDDNADTASITSVDSEMSLKRRSQRWKEKHREKQDDVDVIMKSFEKPNISHSIANCEEAHLEGDEKASNQEPLKDDDNLDSASITSVDSEMSLSRRKQRWKEKYRQKRDDVDAVTKSSEKPDAGCSIVNCEEAQLDRDEKTFNEEPLKDDDNLDSASITSVDSEMSLSRRKQRWKEKYRQKRDDVDAVTKSSEKPDAGCSIVNCEEAQLDRDEKTFNEEHLKDDDNLDSASITLVDSEMSLSRRKQRWKEKYREKRDDVDVVTKSFEKPDAGYSIVNCKEAQLDRDEKTFNEEPLKDDDNLDSASITSVDSEMSLSRRKQRWKEKYREKRDDVDVVTKSFETPDAGCSIVNCKEAQLDRDEKTSNEEPLKDDDNLDSASITSVDSEMSLSRRRQCWKEKHRKKQDNVYVVTKSFEKNDASCSIADCEEKAHLKGDEVTDKEKPLRDVDNLDTTSITSADSEMSLSRRRRRWKEKQMQEYKKIALEDSEFVRYLELRQDSVMDEHPELSEEEITNYLYKTWLYEENIKNDKKRTDEIDQTTLVKGVDPEPSVKKVRRKHKIVKEDSQESFKISEDFEVSPKEKSKRSIVRPYYNEEFLDVEDELDLFEIFRTKKNTTKSNIEDLVNTKPQFEEICLVPETEAITNAEEMLSDEIDLVEMYFEQLTTPKPNVFKGLIRERVCEVCEKVGNLVKCKTCHCMFHVDCVKNQTKTSEEQTSSKGKKKKRKYRRKPKNSGDTFLDSEGHSDERTQDTNSDPNLSMEYEGEPIVADAEDFEAKASAKMKEILGDLDKIVYDYESSKVAIPWNFTEPGKCQIVDVKLQTKLKEEVVDTSNFKCNNCEKFETPICFVCKSPTSPNDKVEYRQKCQVAHCYKYYHLECLDHWPQTQFNGGESRYKKNNECFEAMSCPRHVCHTCVSDDPRGCKTRFSGDKLARCVRCPATYHSFTKCLPAGSQVLTGSQIICPRHYEHRPGKVPCHVNTGWCFICALGGTLICCEYCPTSFHAECLNIDPPEGGYMCEDCETGRLPLYGEMVWVKLGLYRWWPGIILHPSQIPQNILAVKHSQGEFVVRFFGQYDHYWVNRGRVFPFQEGDTGKISTQKSKIDAAFTMAVEHAWRACEILKNAVPNDEDNQDIASSLLPPHYVKLKVNKPVGSLTSWRPDLEESSLTQCECDPNDVEPCGAYSQCLNRMLLTECGPTCRAGDRCNNRAFEKRLYPKMEPYRTPHRGWGLKCLEDVRAGQFVIEYVGELLDEAEFQRRMRRKHEVRDENFYFLTLDKERMIDAGPKGNLARFMNHSCEPNCETQKWTVLGDVRVGLFAINDIPANSELTFNYNLESAGIEKKQCMCGAKRCSGYIGAKPKQDDPQPKKNKVTIKKKHNKRKNRKNVETSPAGPKPKQRIGRPTKPKELTEIEKDLLIIKSATHTSSDSEYSERLSIDSKDSKGFKRKRAVPADGLTLCIKRVKTGDGDEFRID